MSSRARAHIRENLIGYVAVFIALSGTAYAVDGPLAGTNTVGTEDVINNDLRTQDLRNGHVTSEDVANDTTAVALTGTDIASGSLTGADIQNGSLTGQDVADNQLNSDDIWGIRSVDVEDDSLTGADINEGTLNLGCQIGTVKGFALIKGSSDMSSVGFVSGTAFIQAAYSCNGGRIAVMRESTGVYDILFERVDIRSAQVTSSVVFNDSDRDNFVSVRPTSLDQSTHDVQVVTVEVVDNDGDPEDGWFQIAVM